MLGKCHVDPIHKVPNKEEQRHVMAVFLAIWGMGCSNCAARVRNSLLLKEGVVDAYVDHIKSQAIVVFNPELVVIPELIHAVSQAGGDGRHEYQAEVREVKEIP